MESSGAKRKYRGGCLQLKASLLASHKPQELTGGTKQAQWSGSGPGPGFGFRVRGQSGKTKYSGKDQASGKTIQPTMDREKKPHPSLRFQQKQKGEAGKANRSGQQLIFPPPFSVCDLRKEGGQPCPFLSPRRFHPHQFHCGSPFHWTLNTMNKQLRFLPIRVGCLLLFKEYRYMTDGNRWLCTMRWRKVKWKGFARSAREPLQI